MSGKKIIKVNIDDLADPIMVVTNRLWDLAGEQRDKGNMAMHYVLEDLHTKIQNIMLDAKYPNKKNKERTNGN